MFATLGGSIPAPPSETGQSRVASTDGQGSAASGAAATDLDELVRAAISAQVEAGLEPVTDGSLRHPDRTAWWLSALGGSRPGWTAPVALEDWTFAAEATDRAVKQVVVGPFTLGRASGAGSSARRRRTLTLGLAEALNAELRALVGAGCLLVQVEEDAATGIGDSPSERGLFVDAQRRLLDGVGEGHVSLAIRGGNADTAGSSTILDAPYSSYLFDLCAGPDNWRLVVDVPGDRGVIVGAADARSPSDDGLEILAYAIGYAASTRGRGHDRVGVATSNDMDSLDAAAAEVKMRRIGEIARLYGEPPGTLARALDPRAIDIRSAAHGRYAPAPERKGRRR
jgi:methionine synthase II (cobalamin-independent)